MNSGIYTIHCLETGRYYVGRSKQLDIRRTTHFRELSDGIHSNPILQSTYDKYGKTNLVFSVLEYCEETELEAKEQELIDSHIDDPQCMNLSNSASGGRGFGFKHSEETKAKMSILRMGKPGPQFLDEQKEEIRLRTKTLWESDEYRQKVHDGLIGFKHSDETKALQSSQRKGRKLTEDWKKKISEGLKIAERSFTDAGMEKLKNLHVQKTSVKNIETDEVFVFNSRQEAASFAGCSRDVVTRSIQEPEWAPRKLPHFRFSNS